MDFNETFKALTGNLPFPWQESLYHDWFSVGKFPNSCSLPTGLGKTSVVAVWLIALANHPDKVPRRLVYVVNRRTVVDQTTVEVESCRTAIKTDAALKELKESLAKLCALPLNTSGDSVDSPLALSTLRGQFADNREWSADPARPAVIVGTVDMIGSRLLFSGYGIGFKGKPLHAGFLGQDVFLVHDEAHLEPAFQTLLTAIEEEQKRCREYRSFKVMALSATSRGNDTPFELTNDEKSPPAQLPKEPTEPIHFVWQRQRAKKTIHLHPCRDERNLAEDISDFALKFKDSKQAILVFVRKVEDVEKIVGKLQSAKQAIQQLTGTIRGYERDRLVADPIFSRFLPPMKRKLGENLPDSKPPEETVFLVCTSAGEVGVNISADHLICDLSTFESMAQRFGRVNRFGRNIDTEIHVVHERKFDESSDFDQRRSRTLELLGALNGDGSPKALGELDPEQRISAFAPEPTILPTSDILFDAWSLTSIRKSLPGRPPVAPYLHGLSEWEPPETHVAWREEVSLICGDLCEKYAPSDLLDDYPLKPHELLRDNSARVFDRLKKLKVSPETAVWLLADDGTCQVTTLQELIENGKEELYFKTVLLPPSAGGLDKGLLTPASSSADDIADEFYDEMGKHRRIRLRGNDPQLKEVQKSMRLIRTINLQSDLDESENDFEKIWYLYELPNSGDSDGSKAGQLPVAWQVHTDDVTANVEQIVGCLSLNEELQKALVIAARFHDLGKCRLLWQRSIGNPAPTNFLAKSGGKMKPREFGDTYRHEFGSIVDVVDPNQPHVAELNLLEEDMRDVALHLIAVHHGYGRPHFPSEFAFDPEPKTADAQLIAAEIPRRFARLQRKYGRWGLAYIESILRAGDYAASARPSQFLEAFE